MTGSTPQIVASDWTTDDGASEDIWRDAVVWPKPKERVTVRFDQDVLDFFRQDGKGYQTRMNAVLKAYIKAQASQR